MVSSTTSSVSRLALVSLAVVAWLACCHPAAASIIDFETIPGDTPSEGLAITTQFQLSHGVTFQLESGGSPRLAQVGAPATAFWGPPNDTGEDTPAASQGVGQFFLTDDQSVGGPPSALIIGYVTPVSGAGGVILDIDGASTGQAVSGDEEWTIEARDNMGVVIDTRVITAGDPGTGDGLAVPWSFNLGSDTIHSIRISYTGTKTAAVGLAFDNFSPSEPIPEPAILPLVVVASMGFLLRKRR